MASEDFAPFRPFRWAPGPVAQTVLSQLPSPLNLRNEMAERARGEILRLSGGVSVEGLFTRHTDRDPIGLVVMLSGWEGHARSPYMLRAGRALYRAGHEIFRITYPDHGGTHDLNEAAFHFGMLDKMAEAIHRVAGSIRTRPLYVVGFSMGGNVALNLACRGLAGLRAVCAVSPAFDFGRAISALESSFFHRFFLGSWKASLVRKQALFPRHHDFATVQSAASVSEVARDLLSRSGDTRSFEEYTARYSLTADRLRQLTVPAHVLASLDDPIVGRTDYSAFEGVPNLFLNVQDRGGHVGFVRRPWGETYYEGALVAALSSRAPSEGAE